MRIMSEIDDLARRLNKKKKKIQNFGIEILPLWTHKKKFFFPVQKKSSKFKKYLKKCSKHKNK